MLILPTTPHVHLFYKNTLHSLEGIYQDFISVLLVIKRKETAGMSISRGMVTQRVLHS